MGLGLCYPLILFEIYYLSIYLSTAPEGEAEDNGDEHSGSSATNMCVLKPYRGVASDGVL